MPHNPGLQHGPSIPDVTLTLYRMNQGTIVTAVPHNLTSTECFSGIVASPPDRWATITPVASTANASTMSSMPAQTPDSTTGQYGWLPTVKGCFFVKISHSYGPGTPLFSPAVGVIPMDLQAPDVTDLDFCLFRRQDSSGAEIQPQVLWQSSCPTHTPTPSATLAVTETPTAVPTIGVLASATP